MVEAPVHGYQAYMDQWDRGSFLVGLKNSVMSFLFFSKSVERVKPTIFSTVDSSESLLNCPPELLSLRYYRWGWSRCWPSVGAQLEGLIGCSYRCDADAKLECKTKN